MGRDGLGWIGWDGEGWTVMDVEDGVERNRRTSSLGRDGWKLEVGS
jgi:hypothetical protein